MHVGGGLVPRVAVPARNGELLPPRVASEHRGVGAPEHVGFERRLDGLLDLGAGGPDVAQEHGRAVGIATERFLVQVDVDRACQRVRDDQRR